MLTFHQQSSNSRRRRLSSHFFLRQFYTFFQRKLHFLAGFFRRKPKKGVVSSTISRCLFQSNNNDLISTNRSILHLKKTKMFQSVLVLVFSVVCANCINIEGQLTVIKKGLYKWQFLGQSLHFSTHLQSNPSRLSMIFFQIFWLHVL